MKKFIFIVILFSVVFLPSVLHAQVTPPVFGSPSTPAPSFGVPPPVFGDPSTPAPGPGVRLPSDTFAPRGLVGTTAATVSTCRATIENIGDILCRFSELLNSALPVLIALGVVYFVWGVVVYVIASDEEAKKKGRDRIVYGIIGLAVVVGLWGLVAIVVNTFGLNQNVTYTDLTSTLVVDNSAPANSSAFCSLAGNPKFQDLLSYVSCIINKSVIPLIFSLALAMFVWGVVQFVINNDEEAKKAKSKQFMLWGIIALTVMVCVWGLVAILGNTFNINTGFVPQVRPPSP